MSVDKKLLKLVGIPSETGNEKRISDYLFQELKKIGLEVIKQEINSEQANIIGFLRNDKENLLILHAHMDTVGVTPELWEFNPYGELRNNNVYGLGACDVKGSIAVILESLEQINLKDLEYDLMVCFVVNEEIDGEGSKELVKEFKEEFKKYSNVLAIVCEPTELNICLGNKGSAFIKMEFKGKEGHASRPEEAINPLLKMSEFLKDLERIQEGIKKKYNNTMLGSPTITPTIIETNNKSPNKIPSRCYLTLDVRTIPCFEKELSDFLRNLERTYDCEISFVGKPAPSSFIEEDSEVIIKLNEVLRGIKESIKKTIKKSSTDAGFFTMIGIPTVIIGPGNEKKAHQVNECISIKELNEGVKFFKSLLNKKLFKGL